MDRTLLKIVKGEPLSQQDVEEILYEICDREHSGCNSCCPIDDAVESHFGCSRVDWYNTAVRVQTRCSYCGTERRYDIKQCPGCGAMEE